MSNVTIPNPKVFISYAWKSQDYSDKVVAFAISLLNDGVDVVLDKFELRLGNDTYAFMEKCVNDVTVTNVLILLDPVYAEKANSRSGGVGTETQIISTEVYDKTDQTKFIPIVFERNETGDICKPTYLKPTFHIDLSIPEMFDSNYKILVKKLYGIDAHMKPELGTKPSWVESSNSVVKLDNIHNNLKIEQSPQVRNRIFLSYLEKIHMKWEKYAKGFKQDSEDVLSFYDGLLSIRDEYLDLLLFDAYLDNPAAKFTDFLQEAYRNLHIGNNSPYTAVSITMLHEIFLYTVAYFFKVKDYDSVGYILTKSYFNKNYSYNQTVTPCGYELFFSAGEHSCIDNAMCKKDGKPYHSGTAEYWIINLNYEICSKNDLVMADLLCYNCSVFGNVIPFEWYWFPLTYVYGISWYGALKDFSLWLISQEKLQDIIKIFGYDSVESFISKFYEIESAFKERRIDRVRHGSAFESAPLLCDYVKHDAIGKFR